MRTQAELERLYVARPAPPRERGVVSLLVVRSAPAKHTTPSEVQVTREHGVVGDRWSAQWHRDVERQITVMMTGAAELVCDGQPLHLPGDNLVVDFDLGTQALPIGTRVRAGTALLEVTKKPHNGCKKFLARFGEGALAWVNDPAHAARKLRGINCRVIEPGVIRVGDAFERA